MIDAPGAFDDTRFLLHLPTNKRLQAWRAVATESAGRLVQILVQMKNAPLREASWADE
ncbi:MULTISPECIES: hypothetical protein [Variovorax]|uniref:hypothetical protein n=1 Tax=Variovorax TaxID=34072 RepID=UPI001AD4A3B6|nr:MULTISPECIES: hypothetical protein [Variovorax]MBN8752861.1 hypothetical protein [Variovorax sp.]UKI07999.1 hypothetical protein L3V85_35360 [Variovorax paradoxus]